MTHPTEIETFQGSIQSAPEIQALVEGVAASAEFQEATDPTRFGDPLSASLSLVAVAALWQLLRVGIGALRRLSEDATVERRIHLIRELQQMGYERQAPFIVDRLLQEIRARPEDDPVLKQLMEMQPGCIQQGLHAPSRGARQSALAAACRAADEDQALGREIEEWQAFENETEE